MKRFVSLFVVIVLVLSMVPVSGFAAEVRTVYWDPVSGNDTNDGLKQEAPIKTMEAAYAALAGADEGGEFLDGGKGRGGHEGCAGVAELVDVAACGVQEAVCLGKGESLVVVTVVAGIGVVDLHAVEEMSRLAV